LHDVFQELNTGEIQVLPTHILKTLQQGLLIFEVFFANDTHPWR